MFKRTRDIIIDGGLELLETVSNQLKAYQAKVKDQGVDRGQLDALGAEVPDPVPLTVPINRHQARRIDEMRQHLQAVSALAAQQGLETFEESEQFDFGDDGPPRSPFYYATDDEILDYGRQVLGAGFELNQAGDQFLKTTPVIKEETSSGGGVPSGDGAAPPAPAS